MRDALEFWIQLHSHPEIEISFKFIPKILMSKECVHFFWATLCLCILGRRFSRSDKQFRHSSFLKSEPEFL